MKEKPTEIKYCLDIIISCGKMLEIADKPTQGIGFPGFTRLPRELRDRIYNLYTLNFIGAPNIIPRTKRGSCACAGHEPPGDEEFEEVEMNLAYTSKQISNEFLGVFYSQRRFHFSCACEIDFILTNNTLLKSTMTRAMFHWCGLHADDGIRQLQRMEQLSNVIVVISRTTSRYLSHRAQIFCDFFGDRRPLTLLDARGWKELISIRGLNSVRVHHINKRKADRRTDDERNCLENMLREYLMRPADDAEVMDF
ncbi:hypothetical protein F4777DRAFT_599054 [Nemania sp. FL0916]|nr:hypothetical protein F4777DRAFT_599054 [Nemania sp. FL0916]